MKNSSFSYVCGLTAAGLLCGATSLFAADDAKAFAGRWALIIPGGGAGWLGVEPQADGSLKGSLLWGGGSVTPVNETKVENGALVVVRVHGAGWRIRPLSRPRARRGDAKRKLALCLRSWVHRHHDFVAWLRHWVWHPRPPNCH